jgi:hypothetical protein
LKAAVEASAKKHRRKITSEVIVAIEEYLERTGFWPWPPPTPP